MGVYSNHLYLESYPSPMIFEISYVQMHIKDSYSNTFLDAEVVAIFGIPSFPFAGVRQKSW
jgi:hypothetical protein